MPQNLVRRGTQALLDPLPFDSAAARAYGLVCAATCAQERKPAAVCGRLTC